MTYVLIHWKARYGWNYLHIWRTLILLSKLLIASAVASKLPPLLMVACANQKKHISGNFCYRNEPFLWNPKCPSYLEPKLIILFSLFTRVGKQKCSNYLGNSSHPCQLYTNIWRNVQDSFHSLHCILWMWTILQAYKLRFERYRVIVRKRNDATSLSS